MAFDFEDYTRRLSESNHAPTTTALRVMVSLAEEYGEHKDSCHKHGSEGSIENDCSCGWGPISFYLRRYMRAHRIYPYDKPE